ncbi:MAG TPA: SRPBCC domain-containing protein [Solirubrobacterales bacterium]|nr:SRPBCC domain-containing protein [Solirubrobacterales bacterium]
MPDKYARLEEVDGCPALLFERVLPHPPERIWAALTDTAEMFAWHPTPAEFEPRVGGRVVWDPKGHVADLPDSEVTAWDPPRRLGYTWTTLETPNPDHLLWELHPHDDGCLLVLLHTFDDRLKAARDGAGWHVCLDALAAALDGAPDPPGGDPDAPGPWEGLNTEYQGRFNISPEEATPPPVRD